MTRYAQRVVRPTGSGVHGTLFEPQHEEPQGAAIVIGGSDGSEPSCVAEALAAEGVAALSVAYFARPGLPAQLRDIPLEYFRDAIQHLIATLPSGRPGFVAVGVSRGSEAALLSAVHFRDLVDGVVAAVPGNVVLCSWPPGGPAWLLAGHPLPYVNRFGPGCERPDAIIPVELVRGPVLLVAAGVDRVWPSAAMARAISERLRAFGHSFDDQLLEYPDAGHSLGRLVPTLRVGLVPPGRTEAARADAWPNVVQFVRQCHRRE
jgi:dienelactone hydrolase